MKSEPAKQFLQNYLRETDLTRDIYDVNPISQLTEQSEDYQEGMSAWGNRDFRIIANQLSAGKIDPR